LRKDEERAIGACNHGFEPQKEEHISCSSRHFLEVEAGRLWQSAYRVGTTNFEIF
jgi:hypothetical protein